MNKLIGVLMLASVIIFPGAAYAQGGIPNQCSPINNLTVKGDARVGELSFASVEMSWSAKPCVNGQLISVETKISNWKTGEVVYQNSDSGMSGKVKVFVPNRQLYQGTVVVTDTVTGLELDRESFVVSTTPRGV